MEILYEYTAGSAPLLVPAIIMWSVGGILTILCVVMMIMDGDISSEGFCCLLISVLLGCVGFVFNRDTRRQEVKATLNDTITWREINEKYELINQEGEIYTFKVKEDAGEN